MFEVFQRFIKNRGSLLRNFQNAGFYFLGSIVQSVFALFTQPIYSLHLSAVDFGILGYFEAIKGFFTPLFIFSMTSVYLMRYFKQSEDENKKLLFNITFFLTISNTITLLIGYLGIYLYFKKFGVEIPLNPFAWYILIALLLENVKTAVLINFRIRRKAMAYFLFSVLNTLLNVGIGLLFVAILKWGAPGRMLAPIVSALLLIPYCIYILKKYTTIHVNLKEYWQDVRIAFPLVLAAYAYFPISNIDRFFLERLNNLSGLGLYNIGLTIAGYIQLAPIALALAFEPDIFQSIAQHNNKKLVKLFFMMFVPFLIMILIFMLFSETIISLLTAGRYIAAEQYTNIALIAVFLMSIYSFFDKLFVAMGKTRINLIVNCVGGLSSIIIMYFAVTKLGFIGAAYGKVFIALVMVLTSSILAIKYLKLQKIRS